MTVWMAIYNELNDQNKFLLNEIVCAHAITALYYFTYYYLFIFIFVWLNFEAMPIGAVSAMWNCIQLSVSMNTWRNSDSEWPNIDFTSHLILFSIDKNSAIRRSDVSFYLHAHVIVDWWCAHQRFPTNKIRYALKTMKEFEIHFYWLVN